MFDYLRADVSISGTVPRMPRGAKIMVEDYSQQFSRAGPGMVSSRSEHMYLVEGTNKEVPFTVEQSIRWDECSGSEGLVLRRSQNTVKLTSSRNFIMYIKADEIVRYAMTSSMSALTGSEDPCDSVDCGDGGVCLAVGSSHSCTCLPGYSTDPDTGLCRDTDECAGQHQCDQQAVCTNTPGSYHCSCLPGYLGDGRQCLEERSCTELACSDRADCVRDSRGQAVCVCRRGFRGDGRSCSVIPSDSEY